MGSDTFAPNEKGNKKLSEQKCLHHVNSSGQTSSMTQLHKEESPVCLCCCGAGFFEKNEGSSVKKRRGRKGSV